MDLSGIIFVVLALAWAVYLIPKALKHHDEVAQTRSIDRFSTAMRVLARREPVNRRDARLVVTPARSSTRMLVPTATTSRVDAVEAVEATTASAQPTPSSPAVRPSASQRAAARAAARRRRHLLALLVVADLVMVGLAAFAVVPWWTVAVPAVLTLGYLFLCRRQARRGTRPVAVRPTLTAGVPAEPRRAVRVHAPYGTAADSQRRIAVEVSPDEDTVTIPTIAVDAALSAPTVEQADVAAVRAVAGQGGSLWDPLPMTLPTYVSKPRAARTVRTIDLSEPGTWSSGRSEADSKLVEDAESSEAAKGAGAEAEGDDRNEAGAGAQQHAVGS